MDYDFGDFGDFDMDALFGSYGDPIKPRELGHTDVLVWLVFPFAAVGLVCSLVTLVFVALFPKPLKTTIVYCIVLCVSSILTCLISMAQASTWEILADLKGRGEDADFVIIDYAISWITILLIGVSNWLFVAFVAVRLCAILRVNINRYHDYVDADAGEQPQRQKSSCCYICKIILVVLFFGWLLPTVILPLVALVEFYHNWLEEDSEVVDILRFAFEHDFNHRWGSVIYLLLPIGITVVLSGIIVFQTVKKLRGLKFMQTKWDKAKLTLGAILIFLVSRIPMLVYVFFAFLAYAPAPKKTGDPILDAALQSEYKTFTKVDKPKIVEEKMGPLSPVCLIFLCLAAAFNLPLFYIASRRFKSLCGAANAACRNCCGCGQRRKEDDEAPYASPVTASSYLSTPIQPRGNSPSYSIGGNYFFNPVHLKENEKQAWRENGYSNGYSASDDRGRQGEKKGVPV